MLDLNNILAKLLLRPEDEIVEFKQARNDFSFDELGKYFSALSNEANLHGKEFSWLVFGVEDKTHEILGSHYREYGKRSLNTLKHEIADKTSNRISFVEIYELTAENGERVVMFQIPAAPRGIPVAFSDIYYGREGESLKPLSLEELERIRSQNKSADWSAEIINEATLDDLSPEAIQLARLNFQHKFPHLSEELKSWNDTVFLNKARFTIHGKITKAAILLLGKPESESYLVPADIKIRWILKNKDGSERDYAIFGCPFLLAAKEVFDKIRKLKYRYLQEGSLFPEEVNQYEPYDIREAINNCIAHSDYRMGGRINVVEYDDKLVFSNMGSFIPGTIENVIERDAPEEHYRNPLLIHAMFNIDMVDTIGSGIRRIFLNQRRRFFPMPDYDLSNNRVQMTLHGEILDMKFATLLAQNQDLSLRDIMWLDKVQKHLKINDEVATALKKRGLLEGRKPNWVISAKAIQNLPDAALKARYIDDVGLDDNECMDRIVKYLRKFTCASRQEISTMLWKVLPAVLDDRKKYNKITNLLSRLKRQNRIRNVGFSKWELIE